MVKCSDEKPCNKSDCPDCQNDRFRKQYKMRREIEKEYGKLEKALRNLVEQCPTTLKCDEFHHAIKDQHGAEEECEPCCRYYKALYEASVLLG